MIDNDKEKAVDDTAKEHADPAMVVGFILAGLSLYALGDQPYSYYEFLRLAVCGGSLYLSWAAFSLAKQEVIGWIMVGTTVLWNPLIPFTMERESWAIFNLIAAVAFIVSALCLKSSLEE